MKSDPEKLLELSSEVADALHRRLPIVAIESSMVSPAGDFPKNIELYSAVADVLRSRGVIPAILAVMDGRIRVGLDGPDLERFARAEPLTKVGRRDLPVSVTRGEVGSTTVSSALYCAHLSGLPIVMTGAIGGVHRGYEETLDASADLEELARTRAAVVCAGAKVILDLARTLEYLETKGVPVLGYGTDDFPAYFCASGLRVDRRLDSAADVARVMGAHWALGMDCGMVVAVPPSPEIAADRSEIEVNVRNALSEATRNGVVGKAITPFLLAHLEKATGGLSDRVRRASVLQVAKASAEIAIEFSMLMSQRK
jgi:pseudouridine-5'-phosphate glycosidase